jgi:uncharacterized RDD family membrane protein YckC
MTHAPPRHPADDRPAGIVTRTLAVAVDVAVVLALMGLALLVTAGVRFFLSPLSFSWPAPSWPLSLAVGALLALIYLTVGWATSGRSLGAAVLGLRVRGMSGRPLGWKRSAIRAAFCVMLPVGLFWCLVSRRRLSLQDILLRSVVVYDEGTSSSA